MLQYRGELLHHGSFLFQHIQFPQLCRENALVLDTFGGSGSTLMACEQMNRICYMLELDEKYASVILRRYVENTGDATNVYVIRDGVKFTYDELVKEVEKKK